MADENSIRFPMGVLGNLCEKADRAGLKSAQNFLVAVGATFSNDAREVVIPEGKLGEMIARMDRLDAETVKGTLKRLSGEELDQAPQQAINAMLQSLGVFSEQTLRIQAQAAVQSQLPARS